MRRLFIAVLGAMLLLIGSGGTATSTAAPSISGGASGQQAPTAPPTGGVFEPQSEGNRIVQGSGTPSDDLGDEGTLCNGCNYSHGNYAGLWQAFLWAEHLLGSSGVDCDFGPNTADATAAFQRRYGLGDDGIVGPQTRGVADNFLLTSSGTAYNLYYVGTQGTVVYLFRDTTSPYNYWIWWGGQWRVVFYNTQSIPGC